MKLTRPQLELLEKLQSALADQSSQQFTYVTEYLGYLPFGQYHWIEGQSQDLSKTFPEGWKFSDLEALESAGHLHRISEWQNSKDELDCKITFELRQVD
ncbi:hypothetical protein [Gimesia maris]|uniref:hypothetical protein n=1 Tax=Gimesia maris TaxID=122 RepID=UPI0030D88C68|tara:strand:- start:266 stop:562 length:297 start_codon:yes stop_codon:yes gene_type:complete